MDRICRILYTGSFSEEMKCTKNSSVILDLIAVLKNCLLYTSTGLPETVQLIVGCHYQCAATLGSGCVVGGDVAAGEGSTESLNLVVNREKLTDDFWNLDVCLEPYIVPGTYMVPVGQHPHGTSLRDVYKRQRWLRRNDHYKGKRPR